MISWPNKQPLLVDGELMLRPWQESDIEFVYQACQDKLIKEFTTIPDPYLHTDASEFVLSRPKIYLNQAGFPYLGLFNGLPALSVSLHSIKSFDLTTELGYWVANESRGMGLASRAAKLLSDFAISIGYRRIEAYTLPENLGSQRTLIKSGFELEATLHNRLNRRNGVQSDGLLFAKFKI